MVDLGFTVEDARVEQYAATPIILFALRVTNKTPSLAVLNVMLNCQVRIEAARRAYSAPERGALSDLFGEPPRWGQTLRSFLWTHTSVSIPAFDDECRVDLPAPCTYDFNVAATKYFHGLDDGDIPLTFLFSGSAFYRDEQGDLQIGQISWTCESAHRLPVALWREMMEHYYPQSAWLRLNRDVFDELYRYKRERGFPTFEHALNDLLGLKTTRTAS